jgi:hypothetical protein
VLGLFGRITQHIKDLHQTLDDDVRDRLSDKDLDNVCNIIDEEISRLTLLKTAFRSGATDTAIAAWLGKES